ncbi:MAG TPA: hypothetical protein P5236_03490 [Paludibacteraceae bacterium]|nr:hypothetical protein [Paludibacteraceae bacterium]
MKLVTGKNLCFCGRWFVGGLAEWGVAPNLKLQILDYHVNIQNTELETYTSYLDKHF